MTAISAIYHSKYYFIGILYIQKNIYGFVLSNISLNWLIILHLILIKIS